MKSAQLSTALLRRNASRTDSADETISSSAPSISPAVSHAIVSPFPAFYRRILERLDVAVLVTDAQLDAPGPYIVYANAGFQRMTGYTLEELLGQTPRILQGPETSRQVLDRMRHDLATIKRFKGQVVNYRKDGTPYWIDWTLEPLYDDDGVITYWVATQRDITEQQHLEADLLQAQKMELVGQLAGSLAHDFNNVLMGVQVGADMIVAAAPPASTMYHDAQLIQQATRRAATLIRRLLMFAGQQPTELQTVDIRVVIRDLLPLIESLVGPAIKVVVQDSAPVGMIRADTTQLEQVLINLVTNARDAMPDGGTLSISALNIVQEADYSHGKVHLQAGRYVRLIVSDTGIGMSEQVRRHMFEPFFTTKEAERGTGLGLATCYRIVTQHHGRITVQSEEGKGSSFLIDVPWYSA